MLEIIYFCAPSIHDMNQFLPAVDSIAFSLLIALAGFTLVQLFYFWAIFSRLAFYRKQEKGNDRQPVSVVICARNEYHNLRRNLPMILEQDYPEFEVVVVNDSSDDDTAYYLKNLSATHKHLSIVHIHQNLNFFSGKKFPLSIGIKSAKYNLVLLTDADCRPASPLWLRLMQSGFVNKTDIVLGYGRYEPKPGILNKLIRFDTVWVAMQYLSYALARSAYMGVGRNLSYRKSLFYQANGFIYHYKIKSGDDDLFINKVATPENTRIEISQEAHTISEPKTDFGSWFRQKRRHLSTGRHYKMKHKLMLGGFITSQILFFVFFILSLLYFQNIYAAFTLYSLRMISALLIFKKVLNKLSEKNLLLYLLMFEVVFIVLNPIFALSAAITKQYRWR